MTLRTKGVFTTVVAVVTGSVSVMSLDVDKGKIK